MITFFSLRSSQSDMPASSKSKTNLTFIRWTYSRKQHVVLSENSRGTSNRRCSWGVLFTSLKSSRCHKIKELTHPREIEYEYLAWQQWKSRSVWLD
jgi:hypothetical protein